VDIVNNISSVTCPKTGNPYAGGIGYNSNNELHVTLDPGVQVGNAVAADNHFAPGNFPVKVMANGTSSDPILIINLNDPALGHDNSGVFLQTSGDAIINATNTSVQLNGIQKDNALYAVVVPSVPATVVVTWTGGSLSSSGGNSTGIEADNNGIGNAIIDASGKITGSTGTVGAGAFYGLLAHAGNTEFGGTPGAGDAFVHYGSGTIDVSGDRATGILAWVDGDGSGTINADAGTIIKASGTDPGSKNGVYVYLTSAPASQAINATVASSIDISGVATDSLFGIRTFSGADAPTTIKYTGPGITIEGGGGADVK
jgi:hypothetical protein